MISFKNKYFSIFFLVCCFSNYATAQDNIIYQTTYASSWEKTQGGQVRILFAQLDNSHNDKNQSIAIYRGVIEVDLKDGWKTYWRNPGLSGMAPSFQFAQDVHHKIIYPAPILIQNDTDWAYGYHGRVLIPFEVEVPLNMHELSGSLMIGICETICMPVDVGFSFNLDTHNNLKDTNLEEIIVKAWAERPTQPNNKFEISDIQQQDDNLQIILRHPVNEKTPELFLDGGATEFGVAKILEQKSDQTFYQVPIIYRSSRWDETFFYTAKGAISAVSGEATLK